MGARAWILPSATALLFVFLLIWSIELHNTFMIWIDAILLALNGFIAYRAFTTRRPGRRR